MLWRYPEGISIERDIPVLFAVFPDQIQERVCNLLEPVFRILGKRRMNICSKTIKVSQGQVLYDIRIVRICRPDYALQHPEIVVHGLHRFVIERIEAFGLYILQKIELAYY